MTFLTGTYTPHGRRGGFVLEARHESAEDTLLRERALAPVEAAVRSHFLTLGRTVDDATVHNATSIVMRGLTPSTLARIASSGMSSTDLIQALVPRPVQAGVLPPFNWSSITPAQIEALRAAGLLRGDSDYRRALALAMREGPSGSREYNAVLGGDLGAVTRRNYAGSPYDLAGIPFATFDYLRAHGFHHHHMMRAANDAEALGFRGNHAAIHDHAIIRRHSIDPEGMNAGLRDFRTRLEGDQEYRDLARRLAEATTEEGRQALRAQLRARERAVLGESTLPAALNNPAETPEAREAAERRRRALIEESRRHFGIRHLMGDEASLNTTVEQLVDQPTISRTGTVVPEGNAGNLLATVTPTPGAGTRDANAGSLLTTVSAAPAAGTVTPDANAGNLLTTVAVATPDANADSESGQGPNRPGPRVAQNTTVRTPTLTG